MLCFLSSRLHAAHTKVRFQTNCRNSMQQMERQRADHDCSVTASPNTFTETCYEDEESCIWCIVFRLM